MISRTLARRLEQLETRLKPGAEPVIIQFVWVSSDGSREDGPTFSVPNCGPEPLRTRRGQQARSSR
jgi:hypothetical protein